jgi:hypothetical protein
MIERILGRGPQLGQFPLSGRHVAERADHALREAVEVPCRVIYRVRPRVEVIMVLLHQMLDAGRSEGRNLTSACVSNREAWLPIQLERRGDPALLVVYRKADTCCVGAQGCPSCSLRVDQVNARCLHQAWAVTDKACKGRDYGDEC